MNKIVALGLIGIVSATMANAGWLDSLGLGKKKEPATLEEACNKDDITKICPEIVLGEKTLQECLTDNISSLSKQCAEFVNKSAAQKIEETKQAVADKKESVKTSVAERKSSAKAKIDEAKATGTEIKDSAKETGKEIKGIFRR